MKAIEKAGDMRVSYLQSSPPELKMLKQVPVDAIFRGDMFSPFDAPLSLNGDNVPMLGDRVTNLTSVGVPFGLKGTVVVIHASTGYVEVIFDEEFIGGRSLQGNCSQFRGRLCPWSGLLRIPNTQLKVQQNSRSAPSQVSHSYPAQPTKQVSNLPPSNSRSSLGSAAVNLKPSSRPTSAAPGTISDNAQQASKLVSLLKGSKAEGTVRKDNSDGKKVERTNPEKSKSILNMLNAPIATPAASVPAPTQSETKTSLLKSALLTSTAAHEVATEAVSDVAVDPTKSTQLKSILVSAAVESQAHLQVEEAKTEDVVVAAPAAEPKKEKKATLLVPSKVQLKKKV